MSNRDSETGGAGYGFALGMVVGVLVGAATAVLLAPQSGTETRELIARRAQRLKSRAEQLSQRGEAHQEEGGLSSEGVTIL